MINIEQLTSNPEFNYAWLLQERAISEPDKIAFIYLIDGELEKQEVTYKQLDFLAKKIAGYLQEKANIGDRALLLYPSGIDYIAAFFGCLYAGIIAIPLYQLRNNTRALSRMHSIWVDAAATFILSTKDKLTILYNNQEIIPDFGNAILVATDEIDDSAVNKWKQPPYQDVAYLQYTSGSTGHPKGVMVGHHNLAHNGRITQNTWKNNENSTIVSWLPLHHDMGLIAMILQAIYAGSLCVFMSPVHFVQRPLRWLQAIHRYKANITGAPNFAFDLCIEKVKPEDLIELDLSSLQIAYNGAEPVRAQTLDKFSRKFAVTGFTKELFYPAYGMAEDTLFTTMKTEPGLPQYISISTIKMENGIVEENTDLNNSRVFVSCGKVLADQTVKIVNPITMLEVSDANVGEIWISGPSKAIGYWNKPEESERIFAAKLQNDSQTTFLRSGDLGFIKDNQLYIVGRHKDLIIIRGSNYYPIDIEFSSENSSDILAINNAASFSIEVNNNEELIIVQAIKNTGIELINIEETKEIIRQAIIEDHEIDPYDIVLVRSNQIPKTSSGKVQRTLCKQLYLDKKLKLV